MEIDRKGHTLVEFALLVGALRESGEQRTFINFTVGRKMLTMPEINGPGYGNNENGENILRRLANVQGWIPTTPTSPVAYMHSPETPLN